MHDLNDINTRCEIAKKTARTCFAMSRALRQAKVPTWKTYFKQGVAARNLALAFKSDVVVEITKRKEINNEVTLTSFIMAG